VKVIQGLFLIFLLVTHSYGQTENTRIKVLLLGTFHFGDTPDKKKTTFPDLFSARRQKELAQMAVYLKKFGTDKVFVERHFTRQHSIDSLYALYQLGKLTDTTTLRNEIIQIGFRTAAISQCRLIAADYRQELPYDQIEAYAKAHENDSTDAYPFFSVPYPFKQKQKSLLELPLTDYYIQTNNFYNRQKIQYDYLHYAFSYGEGADFIGQEFTLSWYDRNLKIFTNILRKLDPAHDKEIVVLFGSSHTAILRQFFQNHPYFEVVEVEQVFR
jgi:hypothetical protein